MANSFSEAYNQSLLKKYQKKQAIVEDASVPANTTKKGYQFGDVTGTLLDITGDVLKGAAQSLEGIVDAGAGIYGKISGKEEKMTKFINKDLAFTKAVNDLDAAMSQATLLGDNRVSNIIHGVGEGVGGMLPSIAISTIPVVGQPLGMATFGIGAGGSAMQEALRDGANYNQALMYGALSGATEVAVEGVSGALGGTNMLSASARRKALSGGLKAAGKTFVEEGTEEVVSDLLNPFYKKLTYKRNEKVDIPSLSDLTNTFVIGGATGIALGGASQVANNILNGKDAAKFNQVRAETYELEKELNQKELKGITDNEKAEYQKRIADNIDELNNLKIKIADEAKKSLRTLNKMGGAENLINQTVRDVVNSNMETAGKMVDALNKSTGNNVKLATVDEYKGNIDNNAKINGIYDPKTNTIYIDPNTSKSFATLIGHELTHGAENTNIYNQLKDFVFNNIDLDKERAELRKISAYENISEDSLDKEVVAHQIETLFNGKNKSLFNVLAKDYSLRAKITSALNKIKNRLSMGSEEYKKYQEMVDTYKTALKEAGEDSARKAKRDETFAKVTVKGKELTPATSYSVSKNYNPNPKINAEEIIRKYGIKNINNLEEVAEKVSNNLIDILNVPITNIDTGMELSISKKGVKETFKNPDHYKKYPVWKKEAKIAVMDHIKELIEYGELESDNVIDKHDNNPEIKYAYIYSPAVVNGTQYNVRIDIKKTVNGNRFHLHDITLKKDNGNSLNTNLSISKSKKETPSSSKDIIKQNDTKVNTNDKSVDKNPFSASADSNGKELTKAQQDYFKDSKVRNDKGELLVVYHGTSNDFNIYDKNKLGALTEDEDAKLGFHFTDNKDLANIFSKLPADKVINDIRKQVIDEIGYDDNEEIEKRINKYYKDNGKVKEQYLNMTKPLDITIRGMSSDKEIGYAINYALTGKKTIQKTEWFDSFEDLADMLLKNFDDELAITKDQLVTTDGALDRLKELGYDGLILPLTKTDSVTLTEEYNSGNKVKLTGKEYIVFEPNQIKNTDNLNPTNNDDIRYSATQDLATARAENKRLREENKFTKEANERLSDYAANIVSEANEQIVREKAYNKNVNRIVKTAQFFKQNYATKQAIGIDSDIPQNLVDMAKLLGKLENRADVNRKNARDIIKLYKERYYNDDNITLDGMLDDQIKQDLDLVINGKGRLTLEDVRALNNILGNARHLIQDFNTVRIGNRNANLDNLIVDGADYIKNSQVSVKNTKIGNYLLTMTKPRTFFEKLDGYNPNGTMTKLYQNIQDGETKKYVAYMTMAKPVDEFFKDHKGYETSLREEIDMGGWKITKGQAMYVAMLVKRPQAEYHLRYGGLDVLDKKGVATNHPITRTEIKTINDSLTDTDKEFLELVRKIFNGYEGENKDSKEHSARWYKVETDELLNGFTNIEEGDNYVPIKTAKSSIRKSLGDTRSFYKELATTVNETFNKETKQNAKNPIKNTNLLDVLVEHIDNVSTYYGLAMPFKTFDLVFNRTVDGYSIREALARKHDLSLTMNYIGDLFADIQGIGNKRQGFDAIISKVRGHYARAVLGLNLKVGLNQTTSYVAAMYLLSPSALSKGLGMKANFDTMFEYCPYAEWRYYNKDMIKAQSLTDSNNLTASKVDKALDKLMFMTTGFDKLTIGKLWNATQVWVEETTGNKIGTEENLKEAGKKLEEVIRLTQPNYNASERPAILRSKSELVRGFVMFMTQPLQNFNILQEGIGKYRALSKMAQTPEIAKAMKQAKADAIRGAIGVTLETAMYVAITTLFKKLLRKKKDDESWGETIAKDFGSSIFGMFPFVRDFYSYMTDGFDIDNVTDSMLNTIAGAVKKGATAIGKMMQGEIQTEQELAKTQRDMTFAITQFAGIPYKNVKNLIEGIAGNIDPTIAYKLDTRYSSSTTYKDDLDKAISKNNNRLADTIISQTLNRKNIAYNKELVKFLREMYKKGYNLMPKQVGKSFTHNGETIELKRVNQQRFINVYAQSEDSILNILQNKQFIKLSDDAKAKAVNNIYDYYYNLAKEDLGLSVDTKSYLLGKTTNVGNLSLILAEISQFSGNGRKEQVFNYLNRQKLSAAEKYLIMGYLGYKNTKGQNQVKAFLNGKNLTQEQKSILYNMTFGEQ